VQVHLDSSGAFRHTDTPRLTQLYVTWFQT